MDSETLRLLEARIDGMLNQHEAVSQERNRLRDELAQARAQIGELTGQLHEREREKAQVKAHVERIMTRLDGLHLE